MLLPPLLFLVLFALDGINKLSFSSTIKLIGLEVLNISNLSIFCILFSGLLFPSISILSKFYFFFGFNFFDADQGDKEVVVDYASRITVKVNFAQRYSVFAAGLLLSGIGDALEELSAMNTYIVADNLKYTKE